MHPEETSLSASRIVLAVVAVVAAVTAIGLGIAYFAKGSEEGTPEAAGCQDSMYGHISSMAASGGGFRIRFDPFWLTTGITASKAAAEDGVVEPGEPVPNDFYRLEEGHRLLTFVVPADATVTVLTNTDTGILSTPISASELSQLVAGETPIELFEQLDSGLRISLRGDTVCAIDQQYVP
jgi:hypothetical protein